MEQGKIHVQATCASCTGSIFANEVATYSSVYQAPKDALLCPKCAKNEELIIDRAETNDVPDLRRLYEGNLATAARE
jgi:RecJ-like exonuclease